MADKHFTFEIISPDRVVTSVKNAVSVTLPGTEGYFGVLANHAPLVSSLSVGQIELKLDDGSIDYYAVCGGFCEVNDNVVTVLAESAEAACDIDIDRAEGSISRAHERLEKSSEDINSKRAQDALKRASNRLEVARNQKDS